LKIGGITLTYNKWKTERFLVNRSGVEKEYYASVVWREITIEAIDLITEWSGNRISTARNI